MDRRGSAFGGRLGRGGDGFNAKARECWAQCIAPVQARQTRTGLAAGELVGDYDPYGTPIATAGTSGTSFGYAGEQTDATGMQYLRARYYAPQMGVFTALDPFEGMPGRPMSLNGYSYVEGRVPNRTDPSGLYGGDVDCDLLRQRGESEEVLRRNGCDILPTSTATPTPTDTPSPTSTPIPTAPPTVTNIPTGTSTPTLPPPVITPSPTSTPTNTVTSLPSATVSPSATSTLATLTPTCTPSLTPWFVTPGTPTQTPTQVPSGCTNASRRFTNLAAIASDLIWFNGGSPFVKTRGIIVGLEANSPIPVIPVSAGGALTILFDAPSWDAIGNNLGNCEIFLSGELGVGFGVDPIQGSVPSLIWSTASLREIAGPSWET